MENSQNISINYNDLLGIMRTAIEAGISNIQETISEIRNDIDKMNERLDKLAKRSRFIHLDVKRLNNDPEYSDYED
jgi:methyl-accepting chemotaxis protein